MIAPLATGTSIDNARRTRWLRRFEGYSSPVSTTTLDEWLDQFASADRDLAARTLDSVEFLSVASIRAAMRSALGGLPGWSKKRSERVGRWFFVPFTSSAGSSGDSMIHQFRLANALDARIHDQDFRYRSELVSLRLTSEDTVVFIDDLAATGNQACEYWGTLSELLAGSPKTYFVLVAATDRALKEIRSRTELSPIAHRQLGDGDNIFSDACMHFTTTEKASLINYCRRAHKKQPKGYGDCGFLLVLAHRCPNNSIPILHAASDGWQPLFPRHDG